MLLCGDTFCFQEPADINFAGDFLRTSKTFVEIEMEQYFYPILKKKI